MYAYQVGQPYNQNRQQWPEVIQYNYRGGEHELVLFLNSPTADEIRDVAKGEARFALYAKDSQIVLLFKFGDSIAWSDAPYTYHRIPADQQQRAPEITAKDFVLLHVILVDAATGIIKALRVIGMQPPFAQALHRAINTQADMVWDPAEYDRQLQALFRKYNSHQLAQVSKVKFSSKL
jgi:hypothetical protein